MKKFLSFFLIFILTFSFNNFAKSKKIKVVVSIIPLYNIVKEIGKDKVEIKIMVPYGSSPHTFAPKPKDIKYLQHADVFVKIGAGLEFWDKKILNSISNKNLKIVVCSEGIKLLQSKDKKTGNPHIWLDPIIVKEFSKKVYKVLAEVDSVNKKFYKTNYKIFSKKIDSLDKYIKKEIKKFKIKKIVAFHPSWVYFEKRYGIKEVGVIEKIPGKKATLKEVRDIINNIKKYEIKAIFAEPQLSRKIADIIAKEAKVKVLLLDPLGKPDDSENSYIKFIKNNFKIMKEAMQ